MSSEDEKTLIEDPENRAQEDDPSDLVLIFRNPYNDPDMGLTNQIVQVLDAKDAKLFYRLIFRLQEKADKENNIFGLIEKKIDKFIDINTKDGSVELGVVAQKIIEDILVVLQDHLLLDINAFYSRDRDEIFVRVKSNEQNLMVQADLMDYTMQFKKGPLDIQDFKQVPPYGPFESGSKEKLDLFKRYGPNDEEITNGEDGSLFQNKDRERLVYEMINSVIDLSAIQSKGIISNVLSLHRKRQRNYLLETWAKNRNPIKKQDIEKIRVYFGEKVAMYFAWIEFMLIFLWPFAVISLVLGILFYVVDGENDEDSFGVGEVIIIVFAFMLPLMSSFFDQLWQRQQSILAWKWGTSKLETSDEQRPQFKGEYKKDEITGRMKKVAPQTRWTTTKKSVGFSVVLVFVCLVLAIVVVLFIYRSTLDQRS